MKFSIIVAERDGAPCIYLFFSHPPPGDALVAVVHRLSMAAFLTGNIFGDPSMAPARREPSSSS
jgi:hypothetical protein